MMRRGVRYYRAVPPPESEWEGDYAAMARAGLDFVVVPVTWSWSHVGEDSFDFSALRRQLELAGRHRLGIVVAAGLTTAPPWLTTLHPECLHESAGGTKARPRATADAPGGGWPGLCFDNGAVRAYAGRFLRALAATAVAHPGLAGYDLSNAWALEELHEGDWDELYCQCPGSRARFIAWLRRTYVEDLDALCRTWGRRFREWAEVGPPAGYGRFPDVLDWFHFHRHQLAAHLRWCVEALRESDPGSPVLAAGAPPGSELQADSAALAREVSQWGCRLGGCLPHEAADRAHGFVAGKRLWLADLPAHDVASTRRLHWSLCCADAEAVVYEAWRPDCRQTTTVRPAVARPDGGPSARLAEIREFSDLLARHPDLAKAHPGPPEAAVVVVPESQVFWRATEYWGAFYEEALNAAYETLSQRGAQTVFAPPNGLAGYPLAYVPLAFSMSRATAQALCRYVETGGRLVAEACLGLFDEHGIAGRVSPGQGLDEVFGARALDAAEHVPQEGPKPTFTGRGGSYPCYLRREPLEATTGSVKARFADGAAAIVDHTFGDGATRLIGTLPSLACSMDDDKRYARIVLDSLAFARLRPRVTVSSPGICVRLLEGDSGERFLCAFNPTDQPQEATLRVSRSVGSFRRALDLATGKFRRLRDNARRLKLKPADGLVLRLQNATPRPRWRPRRKATRR
jgi:beta-galactosidase GanA